MSESDYGRGDFPAAPATGRGRTTGFSPHGVINGVFLFLVVAALVVLGSLRVAPKSGRVTLPFSGEELPETCRHLIATGQPCPSCGVTRSVIYALHGDPDRSRHYHPAGLPIVIMLLVQCGMRVVFLRPARRSATLDIVVSAGMLVAFAVLVN